MTTSATSTGRSPAEQRAISSVQRMERLAKLTPDPLEHFSLEAHDINGGSLRRSPSFSPDEDSQVAELYWLNLQPE